MCGITGWLDWERDLTQEQATLRAMSRSIAHRGPDADGMYVTRRAALAHRRLKIIDPEGGAQPMVLREDGRTWVITYNGEIYNFQEIRRDLEALGHVFRTRCDTEVILRAYAQWGDVCVERLNGIFAFAVWDEAEGRLFLARDRLGVKPLYYAVRGRAVLFGSELKALLENPLVAPEIDAEGLTHVLAALRPVHTGVYRGVEELLPGHKAVFDSQGARVEAYWRLESREHRDSLDETVAHVRALLSAAVERQLVSDVPVGLLLSGGLDSSGIVALATAARRRAGAPLLDAFTLDLVGQAEHFEETILRRDLDLPWAKRVAEHTGAPLRLVTIDPDELVDRALEPMRAYDRPASGEIDTSMLVMFKRLKKEATVILSGESADEVFGGYPWFYVDEFVGHEGFPWARDDDRATLLAPAVRAAVRPEEHLRESYRALMAEVPRLPGESPREARSREIFYMNLKRFLCFLLDRKDRMSMAASVEVRVPFCDHLLVEYMWNVPWSMKYADGIEKGLLRRALAHVLPEDVRRRRKTAYPVAHAPAYMKGVRAEMRRILDDPGSKLTPLLDRAAVERLLQGDGKERSERALTGIDTHLEYLIQMHHWMKEYRVSIKL